MDAATLDRIYNGPELSEWRDFTRRTLAKLSSGYTAGPGVCENTALELMLDTIESMIQSFNKCPGTV